MDLREIGANLNDRDAGLLTTAVALARWHDRHHCCPLDGTPTEVVHGGWIRRCPSDASEHFPRYGPRGDHARFTTAGIGASWAGRRRGREGRYSILAGFVEPGSRPRRRSRARSTRRSGSAITDITYAGSQPWPFPSSLMLGYTARAVGDLAPTLRDGELADAQWFNRAEIRAGTGPARLPPPVSIAHRIITDWLNA